MFVSFFYHVFFFLSLLIIWSGFNSELDQVRFEHNHARASLPQRHEGGDGQGVHQKGTKVSLEGLLLRCIPAGRGLQVPAGKVRLSRQHDGEGRDPALLVHDQVQLVHRDEDQL